MKGKGIKKFFGEFKTFAVKGNVLDLAIGVIIGGAFSKIVSSVVNDVAMPILGMFLGGLDFQNLAINLPRFFNQPDPIELKLGIFINTVIEFVILAFIVFLFVKGVNKIKKKPEAPKPAEPTREEKLLAEIRDILKDRKDK
jgi:large conductance mechanosensitive channel